MKKRETYAGPWYNEHVIDFRRTRVEEAIARYCAGAATIKWAKLFLKKELTFGLEIR